MIKKNKLSNKNYILIKSFLDIIVSLMIIIIFSPIFIFIAILVKLSSRGPIFYLQRRVGKNNTYFNCIKFRTMHPEADDLLKKLLHENIELKDEFLVTHKIKNDPRITPFGKFLRQTSLDEIPQFLNVLKGEMSIVGPRPIVKEEIKKYSSSFNQVISIKPGITGLWQVSGRNNLTYKKRVQLDHIYSFDISFKIDLIIIIRTIGVIIFPKDRGAY